jgi:hypothetical protein
VGCRLLKVGDQGQRCGQRQAAKANIRKICLPMQLDTQQHMPARRDNLIRYVPANPRSQPAHLEAQGEQDGAQKQVLLEAIAATTTLNQLVLERREIEAHGLVQQRREILEGDHRSMPDMDGPQRRERWRAFAVVANTLEIGVEVDIFLLRQHGALSLLCIVFSPRRAQKRYTRN